MKVGHHVRVIAFNQVDYLNHIKCGIAHHTIASNTIEVSLRVSQYLGNSLHVTRVQVLQLSAKPNRPSGVYTGPIVSSTKIIQTGDGNQQNSHVLWKITCDIVVIFGCQLHVRKTSPSASF